MRDDIRQMAAEHLGEVEAMLVVDETGDLKSGDATVGVQRQYTGTAGRIENAQVGVFLTYTTAAGHTVIDREVYLPHSWTDDPARCAAAGGPADTTFATKPALATQMITRALDAGVPAGWVAGDEVYGNDPGLRGELEDRRVGYVLAIGRNRQILTATGTYRCYAPRPVALGVLVRVAGRRWTIEQSFQTAKGQTGLDEHQVRTWTSWYRWTTLVMLVHLFLAITTVAARAQAASTGLVPLALNEIRHLFAALVIQPARSVGHVLWWSQW